MSRDDIRKQFCDLVCAIPEDHSFTPWLCEEIAEKAERLLADEREKVREMCLEAISCVRWDYKGGDVLDQALRTAIDNCAKAIRQLGLTKDLAASSREEGKK